MGVNVVLRWGRMSPTTTFGIAGSYRRSKKPRITTGSHWFGREERCPHLRRLEAERTDLLSQFERVVGNGNQLVITGRDELVRVLLREPLIVLLPERLLALRLGESGGDFLGTGHLHTSNLAVWSCVHPV